MTKAGPQPEPSVPADAGDEPGDVEDGGGWPRLSELDLDVCLSVTLPRDGKRPRPAPPPRPQA